MSPAHPDVSRVLVTGARGFVGAPATEALAAAGHEVHAVGSGPPPSGRPGVTWHRTDLLDPAAVSQLLGDIAPAKLLHLAWYTEHGRFWRAPENLAWVEATLHLLRAFQAAGGTRAVLAGTCAEYDWTVSPLSERSTPLAPATLYGSAKHATRLVAEAWAREVGLELAWGRIFFLYGPGEAPDRLLPSVARALLAGHEAPTTAGEQVRDFLHVDDVAGAFVALLGSDVTGAVNIASGDGVAVREFVELVAEATGRPDLLRVGAIPMRADDPPHLVADVRRLHEEVGFTPLLSLREGVEAAVDWWRPPSD